MFLDFCHAPRMENNGVDSAIIGLYGEIMQNKAHNHDMAESLRQAISQVQTPLILIYSNPDPDALASAAALREIVRTGGVQTLIRYTGEVGRLENQTMINVLSIPAEPLDEHVLKNADMIALVDAQPDFFKFVDLPRVDIVIDHHPRKNKKNYPFCDIRSTILATSSIMTAYLRALDIPIPGKLATALYYGIKTDSSNSNRWPTEMDSDAIRFLESKVKRNLLRKIEFSSYSIRRLDYFSIALTKLRHARNILYSDVGPVPYADVCAQIADFLIRVKEADWALVSGVVDRKLVIVFRCDGHQKSAGKTAAAAFGSLGSAGGHRTMGRAEIEEKALPPGINLTCNETIERFVIESLAAAEKSLKPLLRTIPKAD